MAFNPNQSVPIIKPKMQGDSFSDVSQAIKSLEVIDPKNIKVLGPRILVKIVEKERISKGGIILSGAEIDKDIFASIKGTIVAIGTMAFPEELPEDRPKIGDHIHIAKYSGLPLRDADYNMYRYTNDTDVIAVGE
jgi:co-chaperonin GroES (HSP10)